MALSIPTGTKIPAGDLDDLYNNFTLCNEYLRPGVTLYKSINSKFASSRFTMEIESERLETRSLWKMGQKIDGKKGNANFVPCAEYNSNTYDCFTVYKSTDPSLKEYRFKLKVIATAISVIDLAKNLKFGESKESSGSSSSSSSSSSSTLRLK